MSDKTIDQNIIKEWMKIFLDETMNMNYKDSFRLETIINKCSASHFNALNMEKILNPYVGKLEDFLAFIGNEWGQKIEFDKTNGIILVDENKDFCVCPLVKNNITQSDKMCLCSEAFTQKMFSYILQKKVKVEVIRSWIRDKKSCIYKITIK